MANDYDDDLHIHTDDLRVDELVTELVKLQPVWKETNQDYLRSCEILRELDEASLSPWQKAQIVSYVRLQWMNAAGKAESMGLFNPRTTQHPISQQLSGICLVKAVDNRDALNLESV